MYQLFEMWRCVVGLPILAETWVTIFCRSTRRSLHEFHGPCSHLGCLAQVGGSPPFCAHFLLPRRGRPASESPEFRRVWSSELYISPSVLELFTLFPCSGLTSILAVPSSNEQTVTGSNNTGLRILSKLDFSPRRGRAVWDGRRRFRTHDTRVDGRCQGGSLKNCDSSRHTLVGGPPAAGRQRVFVVPSQVPWIVCGRLPLRGAQGTGACSRLSPPVPGPRGGRGHTCRTPSRPAPLATPHHHPHSARLARSQRTRCNGGCGTCVVGCW